MTDWPVGYPPPVPGIRKLTLDEARALIAGHDWHFARSMPRMPHFYTLRREWAPRGDEDDFNALVQFVRANGRKGQFWKMPPRPYLVIDGWRYWCMNQPDDVTGVVNRASMEDAVQKKGFRWLE